MKELLTLSGIGILCLLSEIFNFKKFVVPLALFGLAGSISFSILDFNHTPELVYGMMLMDNYALAFNIVMCSVAILWFAFSDHYYEQHPNATERHALVLFTLVGGLVLVSFTNLTMLFLGVEILSIPLYVLAGSNKNDLRSTESAFKYFLMGAFASGFLLFGIALIYGVTGTFEVSLIAQKATESLLQGNTSIMIVGIMMILVGLGFKMSAAPFHFWAPDVYQGAPTVITAYMSTIVKTVAFAAFFRLFVAAFPALHGQWVDIVGGMIVLTLFIGNVSAVMQTDIKRMLAYSSISHAGYMLLSVISLDYGYSALLFYTVSYSVATLVAFTVLYVVSMQKGSTSVASFQGLGKSNPALAFAMTISLLSMAGIPPLSGFMAKYMLFANTVHAGHIILVICAVIASLVSVYYYFRLIRAMYFMEAEEGTPALPSKDILQNSLLVIGCIALLVLGIFPNLITNFLK